MRNVYTPEDHKQAFEVWYETRNWSTVARALQSDWGTARKWSEPDFDCQWNCAFHGYDALIEERDRAHQARSVLLAQGETDPVKHDLAMREALATTGKADPVGYQIARSDLERLHQWEYLWSKVYFDATGIVLDWRQLRGLNTEQITAEVEAKLREHLRTGLHCTSLDQAIKNLKIIQEQIDALKGTARHLLPTKQKEEEQKRAVSMDELRRLRQLVKETPPQQLQTMLSVVDDEAEAHDRSATG